MIQIVKKRIFPFVVLSIIIGLFSSCHSKLISFDYSLHHNAVHNEDSTKIAFVLTSKAFRHAKGIARFPGGGISKTEFEKTAIYILSIKNNVITEIEDFSLFIEFVGSSRLRYDVKMAFDGDSLFYNISPASGWDNLKSSASDSEKSNKKVTALQNKYMKTYRYCMSSEKKDVSESKNINELFESRNKVDFMTLSRCLDNVPLSNFELVLDKIWPKSDSEYIDELVYLRNSSALTRRAVVEQIVSRLSKAEIRGIIQEMENYHENLEGMNKSVYELYSREDLKRLRKLLD